MRIAIMTWSAAICKEAYVVMPYINAADSKDPVRQESILGTGTDEHGRARTDTDGQGWDWECELPWG